MTALTERGGAVSVACLHWLVGGVAAAPRAPLRLDVRFAAPGDPTPF